MNVQFNPQQGRTGCCSFARWDNPALGPAMRVLFGAQDCEEVEEIHVNEGGITAYFKYRGTVDRKPEPKKKAKGAA